MPRHNFGYPSDRPCVVCGGFKNNQTEPRFSYTVCEDHQSVPPAMLDKAKQNYELVYNNDGEATYGNNYKRESR